jgi:hypothetical protein
LEGFLQRRLALSAAGRAGEERTAGAGQVQRALQRPAIEGTIEKTSIEGIACSDGVHILYKQRWRSQGNFWFTENFNGKVNKLCLK